MLNLPKIGQKQSKSVRQLAKSLFKAGQASAASAHDFQNRLAAYNAQQTMLQHLSGNSQRNGPIAAPKEIELESDMRTDSDDITNNITYNFPGQQSSSPIAASMLGTFGKIALGAAVAGPVGAGVASIPAILNLLNSSPPAAISAPDPTSPGVNVWGIKIGSPNE